MNFYIFNNAVPIVVLDPNEGGPDQCHLYITAPLLSYLELPSITLMCMSL